MPQQEKTITLNVSLSHYQKKPNGKAISSMMWEEKHLTINQFLNKATSGYTFCHLFSLDNNQIHLTSTNKKNKNFLATQTLFIDIDNTKEENILCFIDKLPIHPQVVYTTPTDPVNNKKATAGGSRRFRMVFFLEEMVKFNQYQQLINNLYDIIEYHTGEKVDRCGFPSQYYNGCYNCKECYCFSNKLIPVKEIQEQVEIIQEDSPNTANIPNTPLKPLYNLSQLHKFRSPDYQRVTNTCYSFSEEALSEFLHDVRYEIFWDNSNPGLWNEYQTESYGIVLYQIVDENYHSLDYYKQKITDGHHRRANLFRRCLLRRFFKPDVDANTLYANYCHDVQYFFEPDWKDLTPFTAKQTVEQVMKMSYEEIETKAYDFLQRYPARKKKIIYRYLAGKKLTLSDKASARAEVKKYIVNEIFDRNKSITENIQILSDHGLDISRRTLHYYLEDKKTTNKQNKEEEIMKHYDPGKSFRANIVSMKKIGLKISDKTLKKIVEKFKPQEQKAEQRQIRPFSAPLCHYSEGDEEIHILREDNALERKNNDWWSGVENFFLVNFAMSGNNCTFAM